MLTTLARSNDKPDPRRATGSDRQIGARIRARRHETSMSQTELAKLIGVTFQQIQKYEKGSNRVAATTLVEIASALEVPITALLPRATQKGEGELSVDTPGFSELSAAFATLNTDGRRLLVSTARNFAADEKLRRNPRDRG